MEFFPGFLLNKNKRRGTPHWSIIIATTLPIVILIAVKGNINVLGDMYAFGLLAAFSLTCLGLDLVRHRERKAHIAEQQQKFQRNELPELLEILPEVSEEITPVASVTSRKTLKSYWREIEFWLGIVTTILVLAAWITNLVDKPLATAFGGAVTALGMLIAITNRGIVTRRKGGGLPLLATQIDPRLRNSVLVVMKNGKNDSVIHTGVNAATELNKPIIFAYFSPIRESQPVFMGIQDSYRENKLAKVAHRKAAAAAKAKHLDQHHVYEELDLPLDQEIETYWQKLHPVDMVVSEHLDLKNAHEITPDRVRIESTKNGNDRAKHLLRHW